MYKLGIDLGGTGIKAGVVDENYNIIGRSEMKTLSGRPMHEVMDDIAKTGETAVKNAGVSFSDIGLVGLGAPGTVNSETGMLEFSGNLGTHKYPLAREMEYRLGKPVFIENDANSAAYGELLAGAAKGASDAVLITLGTGVSSGIIINGKIYRGKNFAGAELGHTVIIHNGRQCNCGRHGCLEVYASVSALVYQTKVAMLDDKNSRMWEIVGGDLDSVNGKTSFDAMRLGDQSAIRVVDNYVSYVACGVVNVINIFQPDIVCIGGGISREGEALMTPLRRFITLERFSKYSERQTTFHAATLGNDAGIIGAANLHSSILHS